MQNDVCAEEGFIFICFSVESEFCDIATSSEVKHGPVCKCDVQTGSPLQVTDPENRPFGEVRGILYPAVWILDVFQM